MSTTTPRATVLTEQMPWGPGWDVPTRTALDHSLAALYPLRGTPCLSCRLERTPTDRSNRDGLCGECRDSDTTDGPANANRDALEAAQNGAPARPGNGHRAVVADRLAQPQLATR